MATGFINKVPGGINVEHLPADKDWGDVNLDSPSKGCGHTTEVAGLPSYGPGQTDSPTFTVGEIYVWQHRGLGKSCGTLENDAGGMPETNRVIRIQFELIGFSTREKWLPKSSFQVEALGAIKELRARQARRSTQSRLARPTGRRHTRHRGLPSASIKVTVPRVVRAR